jgi:hypothetical protein
VARRRTAGRPGAAKPAAVRPASIAQATGGRSAPPAVRPESRRRIEKRLGRKLTATEAWQHGVATKAEHRELERQARQQLLESFKPREPGEATLLEKLTSAERHLAENIDELTLLAIEKAREGKPSLLRTVRNLLSQTHREVEARLAETRPHWQLEDFGQLTTAELAAMTSVLLELRAIGWPELDHITNAAGHKATPDRENIRRAYARRIETCKSRKLDPKWAAAQGRLPENPDDAARILSQQPAARMLNAAAHAVADPGEAWKDRITKPPQE